MTTLNPAHNGLQALRRFTQKQPSARPVAELCELCAAPLATKHHHLVDLSRQALLCACDACAILFADGGAGHGRYQLVPQNHLVSWFAHFLGHKMNCIPHLIPKNGVKLQENRVHPPPIFGGVKSREESLFSHKKLLELSENKGIFL